MDYDTPRFRVSKAAEVSGFEASTLRQYLGKHFVWQEGDAKARVPGATALLSLRSVIRLSIAHGLWTCQVSPQDAFNAAIQFTDFGSSAAYLHKQASRMPCELFDTATFDTWLLWCPARRMAAVVPVTFGEVVSREELTSDLFGVGCGGVLLLPLNEVVSRCLAKLGEVDAGEREQASASDNA